MSTSVPGMMKPETPTTSSTFTVIARYPSGMTDDKPPSEPTGASLDSVTGSLGEMEVTTTRPIKFSSILAIAPTGVTSAGNCAVVSCSGIMREPIGISTFATTTSLVRLKACALSRYCLTETAAIKPKVIAANRAMIKRLFRMMINLHFVSKTAARLTQHGRCDQTAHHDGDAVRDRVFTIGWYCKTWHLPARHDADEDS